MTRLAIINNDADMVRVARKPCPDCGRLPKVAKCDSPGEMWYAICYSLAPYEHCNGVNGVSATDAVINWNKEVGGKGD